jgi:O-antigen/teichoic acid export membrane protein
VIRLAQNTGRWLLVAALAVMFVLASESDRLIGLIYGPHYQDAVWLQKYLVATVICAFLHNLAAFLMMCLRRERLLLLFYLVGLVFNLLWCALAIPLVPLWGSALAMILTKGVVALLTVSYCQRQLHLLPARPLRQVAAISLAGAAGYLLGIAWLTRELAEVLALTPLLILAWHWWRREVSSEQ